MIYVLVIAFALVALYVWWAGRRGVAAARELVRRGALLIDADPPEVFDRAHLAGAVNFPVDEMARRTSEIGPPSRPIVVYPREELRSAHAAHLLRVLGYESVVSLSMSRW